MAANRWHEDFDDFDELMTFRTEGFASESNLDDLRSLVDAVMLTGRFSVRREAVDWVTEQEFVLIEENGLVFTVTKPAQIEE